MKHSIYVVFLCMLLIGMTACEDEEIRPFDDIPEGETTVNAVVEFKPLVPALTTRAAAGDAIKRIENLYVFVYGLDGNLVSRHKIKGSDTDKVSGYMEGELDRTNKTGKDVIAESKTPYARFDLTIPYGRYHIYAVANMGDLEGYDVGTVDKLKGISLTWKSDVRQNNQMLGHFTEKGVYSDDDYELTINRKNMELRAAIRRVASKVTLAFDGSSLKEGVFIYIKSVQIKDIPKSCFLGNSNTPTEKEELQDGDTIKYDLQSVFDENYEARVTRGRPYYPHGDSYEKMFHTETERALFFYENMQGVHEDKDKRQDANKDGELDHPGTEKHPTDSYLSKDGVPCGTYVEVDAYYRSINEERIGNGNIKYRFMLGKNVTTDYNAERNHHYKLTLKFNQFANDADWHIDYEEPEPSIQVPDPYYISYLYNHKMMLPVKVNTGGRKLTSLTANIDTNSWAPYNAPALDYWRNMDPNVTKGANLNPWNGFLSLRRTQTKVVTMSGDTDISSLNRLNMNYWNNTQRGTRDYRVEEGEYDSDEGDGKYAVSVDDEGNMNFLIPMYTRAKQLLVKSAYTGNNPYVAYQRKANVKFVAKLGDGKQIEKNARIMQVRRVVNPKGVWRKHDDNKDFHVVLKRLPREAATSFEEFTSEGKWKAYPIIDNTKLIHLDGVNDTVKGSTGTPIDFKIHFNGTCSATENRCAIIRVEYHDYSCFHLIFVRQGNAPIDLVGNGTYWHTNNMRAGNLEAGCPLEEGSLFKFGNWGQPIDAINNVNDKSPWIDVKAADFKDHVNTPFIVVGSSETKLWSEITSKSITSEFTAPSISPFFPGKKVSVASFEDFEELYADDNVENAYGVMYGNDATETLTILEEVYGHRYDKHQTNGGGYGMRGIFVYHKETGDNLFFPIGASGYGHRKRSDASGTAILRYSSGRDKPLDTGAPNGAPDFLNYRPLFYDLYMRPGAIYWLQKNKQNVRGTSESAIGWDINYFTFDFNYITQGTLFTGNSSDACFVRCVEK